MKKKPGMEWRLLAVVVFCLLVVSGCDLCPEPITRHDFGNVYVGTTAETPQVCWRNHSKNALEVVGIPLSPLGEPFDMNLGRPFQSFIVQNGNCSPYYTFTFTPVRAGTVTGEAMPQLISGEGRPQALELSGVGVYQIAVGGLIIGGGHINAGDALDFGSVIFPRGAASQRRFNLVNMTNQQMQVNAVWSKGSQGFSVVQPAGPITVPPLGRVQVTLQFAPPAVGIFTDGVTFVDQANAQNMAGTAVRGEGVESD
ncbi:MAG: choice-of-anchor D domain-containing protein [Phycisphaerae bacterium]|nr:choice-of-anchor D domain-containing protein [Phycisphaerae bacterium]MDD5381150.1 choice-of-anchor D domain-containing protein [Phycisphaerae bacterium]